MSVSLLHLYFNLSRIYRALGGRVISQYLPFGIIGSSIIEWSVITILISNSPRQRFTLFVTQLTTTFDASHAEPGQKAPNKSFQIESQMSIDNIATSSRAQ